MSPSTPHKHHSTSGNIIQCVGLGKSVALLDRQLTILDDIDLEIRCGESIAIVGASGSGKSTLLGLLAGLDSPSRGRVILDGHDLTALDEEQRARIRSDCVGFVFQSFHLIQGLTALENVMLPAELKGRSKPEHLARKLLQRVGLDNRKDHYPRQLSNGEQQRVAVARAFATSAKVLFADEPTGSLDTTTGKALSKLLFELNTEFGTTLVLVTHDLSLAETCQRKIEIDCGRLKPEPA